MEIRERPIDIRLRRLAEVRADPARIAVIAEQQWLAVQDALSQVIGLNGVAALYKRSLHLNSEQFSAFADWPPARPSAPFASLHAALALQSSEDAVAAHGALLHTFTNLLIILIGGSLTERLLGSVWDNSSLGHDPEDGTS